MSDEYIRYVRAVALMIFTVFPVITDADDWRAEVLRERAEICAEYESYLKCLDALSIQLSIDYTKYSYSYDTVFYSLLWEGTDTGNPDLLARLIMIDPQGAHNSEEFDVWRNELAFRNTTIYMSAVRSLAASGHDIAPTARAAGFAYATNRMDEVNIKTDDMYENGYRKIATYRTDEPLRDFFIAFDEGIVAALDYFDERIMKRAAERATEAEEDMEKARKLTAFRCHLDVADCEESKP